nr:MAG TPA: hypothetical protein [Caudoviricetes sp.]
MVEVEKDYASKGVAGAGLGTGIAGLSLGVLNSLGGLGALAMGNRNQAAAPVIPAVPYGGFGLGGWNGFGGCCSDNMPVTRYDMDKERDIAAKDAEISLLKANIYNDQKTLELYAYVDGQLKDIRQSLCNQAVHNQRTEDSFTLVRQDVEAVRSELSKDIKMEVERRCCGDNAIVTYANATFYPKMVADLTTGTGTTAQTLYNPLPKCGGGCCNGN